MSLAKTPVGPCSLPLRVSMTASALVIAAAITLSFVTVPTPARAQAQGPSTSGGSLPYIASGQSDEEIQKRKRARADAEEKARQATADAEKARQEAARAAAQPEPAATAALPPPAAPASAPATTGAPTTAAPTTAAKDATPPGETAKPKLAVKPRAGDMPPGVNPGVVGDVRTAPQQPRSTVATLPPQHGVVVVRRPMFFGLFGPDVNVTERVVVLTPPASVGSTQAAPRPPAPIGPKVVTRRPTDNCHYHAYATPGAYAHRDIQCHWHQDPGDPSLRYVD